MTCGFEAPLGSGISKRMQASSSSSRGFSAGWVTKAAAAPSSSSASSTREVLPIPGSPVTSRKDSPHCKPWRSLTSASSRSEVA